MAQVIYGNTFSGGSIQVPPSKSAAHRQVLCAALSRGRCSVSNVDMNEDIKATVAAVTALGVQARYDDSSSLLTLDASGLGGQNAVIDCGDSGKVESDVSLDIAYEGEALEPCTIYNWTLTDV